MASRALSDRPRQAGVFSEIFNHAGVTCGIILIGKAIGALIQARTAWPPGVAARRGLYAGRLAETVRHDTIGSRHDAGSARRRPFTAARRQPRSADAPCAALAGPGLHRPGED